MNKRELAAIKVPLVVTCQVTGLQKAYTSREFIGRKIDNYGGDLKTMLDSYVCRDAKRLLREGKSVPEVIKALGGTKDPKEVDLDKLILTKKIRVEGANARSHRAAARKPRRMGRRRKSRAVETATAK
jgi:hypothetical protein